MPLAFIVFAILLISMFFWGSLKLVNVPQILLGTILILFMVGYFIPPISIADKFEVNIIFAFGVLFLSIELIIKLKFSAGFYVVMFSAASVLAYYLITLINSDYLTYFNYFPIWLVVTLVSLFFVKNINQGIAYILLSFLLIEWSNYFFAYNNIGFLSICSYEFLNSIVISLFVFIGFTMLYKLVYSPRKNKKGV